MAQSDADPIRARRDQNQNSYLAAQYQRVRGRRGHSKAVTAVGHSILTAAGPCSKPGAVAHARATAPATLMLFDVLHLGGQVTRRQPYRERRARLEELALNDAAWRTPRAFAIDEDLASITRDRCLEGIVAKRLDAPYQPGRRGEAWLKHKHRHRERLIITAQNSGGC